MSDKYKEITQDERTKLNLDDEKDKGAVKRRLCAVVGGALVFGIIGPIAVCTKYYN